VADARVRLMGAAGEHLLAVDGLAHDRSVTLLVQIPEGAPVRRDLEIYPLVRLSGVVIDDLTETPLPEVRLVLEGTGRGAVSDSAGRVEVEGIPPGRYPVRVRALDEEERRKWARGFASDYLGPEEMARITEKAVDFADVLRAMNSPRIALSVPSSNPVNPGFCLRVNRRVSSFSDGDRCPDVLILIDGMRIQSETRLPNAVLNDLNPYDIRSVEVLGPVEATFRFGSSRGGAGAILVDTREGGGSGG